MPRSGVLLHWGAAAAWTAVDGFSDASFISFADEAYAAMRDDDSRTPVFAEAIQSRLAESPPQTLSVLEVVYHTLLMKL